MFLSYQKKILRHSSKVYNLANFKSKSFRLFSHVVLQFIHFIISKTTVHRTVGNTITFGSSVCLGVDKFINKIDLFNKVSSYTTSHFKEVILYKVFRQPKGDILVARRVLGVRLEGCNFTSLMLFNNCCYDFNLSFFIKCFDFCFGSEFLIVSFGCFCFQF